VAAWLPKDALLVANHSKVLPARVKGVTERGRSVEFLLLTPLPMILGAGEDARCAALAEGLIKGTKRCKEGEQILFGERFGCRIERIGEFGKVQVTLEWEGDLGALFRRYGVMPLPPYIRREADQEDAARYQTVYASEAAVGSVAAPTAGLHFTPELRSALLADGRDWVELALYVGYGTFSPVRCQDIREHRMHAEYVTISESAAQKVLDAKRQGRPLVAVGTTSLRALEGVAALKGAVEPFAGWLNPFVFPGFEFRVVDQLITNFHLPGSTLLMLVSALAGRERVLNAYRTAVEQGFRFFSSGDAMLIR
jgi:S-adenosylmethionine:tRNA ribosyltransferase-isomerase